MDVGSKADREVMAALDGQGASLAEIYDRMTETRLAGCARTWWREILFGPSIGGLAFRLVRLVDAGLATRHESPSPDGAKRVAYRLA